MTTLLPAGPLLRCVMTKKKHQSTGTIVAAISSALHQRDKTQRWLADEVGATPQMVSRWLSSGGMTVKWADKCLNALGLDIWQRR